MKRRSNRIHRVSALAGAALLGATAVHAAPVPAPAAPANPLSLAGGALTFDLEGRWRMEARSNTFDFNSGARALTDDEFLLERLRIGLLYKPCAGFKLYVQGQDSREFFSKRPDIPTALGAEGNDAFDLRQAWMEFGDAKAYPLTLKIGRQPLAYGDERLLGGFEWNNVARTFDAAKLRWEEKTWALDAFAGSVVDVSDVGQFDQSDLFNGREKHRDEVLSGLYGTTTALGPQTTDLYVLHLHQELAGGNTNFFTLGTRMRSKPGAFSTVMVEGKKKPVGFDYSGEFAFQTGKLNKSGVVRDLQAYALNAGGGYAFDVAGTPRVGVAYSYATGDKNSADASWDGFQNLYPTNHKFYGQMDVFSWQNMHDLEANFKVSPSKSVTLKSEVHAFWLATNKDAWYRANGTTAVRPLNAAAKAANSFAGAEADFTATWSVSKPVQVEAGYSHFFAGSYLKGTGAQSDADFTYVQLKVSF